MALQEPPKTLAPRTKHARRTLWIGGITISLALAIIPPWVDSTKIFIQVGIIVGLVGFCIALLVEQSTKLDQAIVEMRTQMERQAAELTTALREVSPVIAAPPLCKDFVDGYVAAYQSIDRRGDIDVFSDIRQSKSSELLDCLHDLSNGAIIVSIDGPYSVRARPFDDVLHYRAVSMGPFEFWTGPFG
ncbi:hypothetical protein [Nonomuraea soli]|uniref:Uncharacterized protein n=1 Tax=Nonomuraea soli TaxID=1032476 RepID=A0A7W0CQY9_9ACTN|nr:hypothetical protein [Nonomuraea soli]MBA2895677.1 hypothetical protein [Nonomuraea soli]